MFYPLQTSWLEEAERLRPRLFTQEVAPRGTVRFVADASAFQGWTAMPDACGPVWPLAAGQAVNFDFGEHGVGHFTARVALPGRPNDAPIRLRVLLAETPVELAEPDNHLAATLSHAWRQEELIVLDRLPAALATARRHAFRYARVEWDDTAPRFTIQLSDVGAARVSSAPFGDAGILPRFAAADRPLAAAAARTLRNCMQEVFEDGPKRDRRLWLGDLRLQALANEALFRRFDLARRCLLLFAGLADADGLVPGCLYDARPAAAGKFVADYAPLFGPTLADYARASGDEATARELLPVAARQAEWLADGLERDAGFPGDRHWVFIDWCEGLDRRAALAGVALYALRETAALAGRLGDRVVAERLDDKAAALRRRARAAYYDAERAEVVSGPDRQISWVGWAWAALSGMVTGREAVAAFRRLESNPRAVAPAGPYGMHHVFDAMIRIGLTEPARARMREYWGGMVRAGLTTFPEVWNTADSRLSPYGSAAINSYCHAWSCTFPWLMTRLQAAEADRTAAAPPSPRCAVS